MWRWSETTSRCCPDALPRSHFGLIMAQCLGVGFGLKDPLYNMSNANTLVTVMMLVGSMRVL